MKALLITWFSFISVKIVTSSSQADAVILHHTKCFENYMHQFIHVNRNYEDSLLACYNEDNINRRPPQQFDPETEMDKQKQSSSEACFSLKACNLITDVIAFFSCHSKNAEENVNTFFVMQLSASSVVLELNDQYDQEEKEILRCQLLAKQQYLTESSIVYKKHLKCLNAFKKKYLGKCDT